MRTRKTINDSNLLDIQRDYLDKILSLEEGVKALVLDASALRAVRLVYTSTELAQRDVFFMEAIDSPHNENLSSIKAFYFIKGNLESITKMTVELKKPRYHSYYICTKFQKYIESFFCFYLPDVFSSSFFASKFLLFKNSFHQPCFGFSHSNPWKDGLFYESQANLRISQ